MAGTNNISGHPRAKRWINFPKGSSLQLVYCWLISTYGTRDGIFTVGITVGLAWEIPVNLRNTVFDTGRSLHDEHRRDLHRKIKRFMDQQGHNGSDCLKRAICEANEIHQKKKLKFIQAMLYAVFKLDSNEEDETSGCKETLSCNFSMFDHNRPIAM
ncbi:hypothetical protein GE061_005317 [Apolygus lucorum]|uniref:Uncharacterized protein n=1 Tax=Apolygus lucorum TaxID=248454 RepID=A0A8S9WVA9_APOLU|nr:hypothetical protein GE061_005317 [Apolygus lucorum]